MLVGRAFVFSVNGRAVAAVAALALSVGYAVLAGSATSTIRDPDDVISQPFLEPGSTVHQPGFEPFDTDTVEAEVLATNTTQRGTGWATLQPWPYDEEPKRGPYAPQSLIWPDGIEPPTENGSTVLDTVTPEHGSLTWIYLPPDDFARAFPELDGQATQAFQGPDQPAPAGFVSHPDKASGQFYVQGAEQVSTSVHALVAGMGLVAAVLSAGAIRLETLARRNELATLEAIAGAGLVKRVVAGRAAVLSLAGVGVGLAGALAGTRALSGLLGGLTVTPTTGLLVEVGLVALGAAILAGTLAGWRDLRHPIAERLGQRGTPARRFPGPLRFFLVTPRLWAGVLAAAIVATAIVAVVAGAAGAPQAILGGDERTLVVGASGSNPFTGEASRFLADHAPLLDDVDAASAETFAPTLLDGEPVMVRGVEFGAWRALNDADLREGRWPTEPGEATAGARLAHRLDLEPGQRVPVPGAHRPVVRAVTVTGIHEAGHFEADELVTDLDTAADLTGREPGTANIVRLEASDPAAREALEGGFGIEVLDLTVRPSQPVPDTFATATLDVINLADERRSRSLSLAADGELVASTTVQVPGQTRDTVEVRFPVPEGPTLDLSVNPERTIDTTPRSLTIDAPARVPVDTPIPLTVRDGDARPVPGANVSVDGTPIGATNASGQIEHTFEEPGRATISATTEERAGGTRTLATRPAWTESPHLRVDHLSLGEPASLDAQQARYEATVHLTNLGGEPFQDALEATVDGDPVGSTPLRLDAYTSTTTTLLLEIPVDAETVTLLGDTFPVQAPSDGDEEPVSLEELLTAQREPTSPSAEEDAFLERFFAELDPVLLMVTLLTFAHAALAVAFGVLREVRERATIGRTLRHLGASREDVAARAARDAIFSVVLPAALGVLGALAGLEILQARGWPAAFGHTLPADMSLGLTVRLVAGLIVVAAGTAALAAAFEKPQRPRQGDPVGLDRLLGGSR